MKKKLYSFLRAASRYLLVVMLGAIVAASFLVCLLVIVMQQRGIEYLAQKPGTTVLSSIVMKNPFAQQNIVHIL